MAYDEGLAERIREQIALRGEAVERKMFGGEPHTGPFEMTGRPARGMVVVAAGGIEDDADLARWVDAGADYALSLSPK